MIDIAKEQPWIDIIRHRAEIMRAETPGSDEAHDMLYLIHVIDELVEELKLL